MPVRRNPSRADRGATEPGAPGALPLADAEPAVTGQVLRFIEEHGLSAGDRLPSERDLATQRDVSRPARRETLATLEALQLITPKPNSGIYQAGPNAYPDLERMGLRSNHGLPLRRDTIVH